MLQNPADAPQTTVATSAGTKWPQRGQPMSHYSTAGRGAPWKMQNWSTCALISKSDHIREVFLPNKEIVPLQG